MPLNPQGPFIQYDEQGNILYWKSLRVTEDFQNIRRIFPTAQLPVLDVVRTCCKDDRIKRVTVFGSALEERHHLWSDIDLYIEGISYREPFYIEGDSIRTKAFDIITPDMLSEDEPIYKEIKKKGVVVYERDDL